MPPTPSATPTAQSPLPAPEARDRQEEDRCEINLGWACNNKCLFCTEQKRRETAAERGQLQAPEADLREEIRAFASRGKNHLTFLGGEPTLRRDFLALVRFARECGFCTLFLTTNGRMAATPGYLERLFDAGLTDICLSIHGPDPATHDGVTQSPGAFHQVSAAIQRLRALGRSFYVSSVLHRSLLPRMVDLARFLVAVAPRRIMWAFPRPAGGTLLRWEALVPRFTELAEPLARAFDLFDGFPGAVTVAHMPFCRMAGREAFVDEVYWQPGRRCIRARAMRDRDDSPDASAGEAAAVSAFNEVFDRFGNGKGQFPACAACRFNPVCEGVWVAYAFHHGHAEFTPVIGPPVTDVRSLRIPRNEQR
ncbi:MAG: radical SAM protein [Planctomycetes bacterium]|nr:radical SAM protein [Planctomycetota bacterium]